MVHSLTAIANGALANCRSRNGSDCEAYAIRVANSTVGVSEATESHGRHSDTSGNIDAPDSNAEHSVISGEEPEMGKSAVATWSETDLSTGQEQTLREADLVFDTVTINLSEAQISRDGVIPVKIIKPGWGSSGYYDKEVLKRDAHIFEGVQMFWDHPRKSEEVELPERSLDDLAGVLHGVTWKDSSQDGPGIYGYAKVFSPYKERIAEMAPYIGLSILASGKLSEGEREGRRGPVIEAITAARSVDFVTVAGAGGKVVSLFESLRNTNSGEEVHHNMDEIKQLQESLVEKDAKLEEANKKLEEANSKLAEMQAKLEEANEKMARMVEADLVRSARSYIEVKVADVQIPDMTKSRIAESLSKNPPAKDGELDTEALDSAIEEAVKAEAEYLASVVGSGKIVGLGNSASGSTDEDITKMAESKLHEAFSRMGLSENAAKLATSGR